MQEGTLEQTSNESVARCRLKRGRDVLCVARDLGDLAWESIQSGSDGYSLVTIVAGATVTIVV